MNQLKFVLIYPAVTNVSGLKSRQARSVRVRVFVIVKTTFRLHVIINFTGRNIPTFFSLDEKYYFRSLN